MAENHNKDLNEQSILSFLDGVVEKIKTEEDPFELNQYRRLFRKVVPFNLRSYFAAYLIKQIYSGKPITKLNYNDRFRRTGISRTEGKKGKKSSQEHKKNKQNRSGNVGNRSDVRNALPEDLSSTLFFSIGRNRRVYPRDIIYIIIQHSGIERDHIGDIRVLDNYSFVQVLSESAEKVILALNGIDYRGRKLSVSFSKKRSSSQDTSQESTFNTSE